MQPQDPIQPGPGPHNDWITLAIKGIALIATIAATIYLSTNHLTTRRPLAKQGKYTPTIGLQEFDSRLWEDPLESERRNIDGVPQPLSISRFQSAIANSLNNFDILAVLVSGGHYSEDGESRIRARHATISALLTAGYEPSDAEHLGLVRAAWPKADIWKNLATNPHMTVEEVINRIREGTDCTNGSVPSQIQVDLAFETFVPRQFRAGRAMQGRDPLNPIVLLWIPDEIFDQDAAQGLATLFQMLVPATNDSRIHIIGPARSGSLQTMSEIPKGSSRFASDTKQFLRKRVHLYSAVATSADAFLVPQFSRTGFPLGGQRAELENHLTNAVGFRGFHNLAVPDDDLAGAMLKELVLRRKDPANPKHHVVLVSEQDTFYGRMMSKTYAMEMRHHIEQGNPGHTSGDRGHFNQHLHDYIHKSRAETRISNLHSFQYLRGLDGSRPNYSSDRTEGSNTKPSTDANVRAGIEKWVELSPNVNRAEGDNQYDSLTRLASEMESLERQLARSGAGHIAAIGIVGADVYDKLLILRALRDRFPQALFFTTELDARLWHPDELPHSRNLLVASGYGLELHPDLMDGVAPFRDSLQTAQFAAAVRALSVDRTSPIEVALRFGDARKPSLIHEIGRNGPLNLSSHPPHPLHPPLRVTLEEAPSSVSIASGWIALAFGAFLMLWKFRVLHRLTLGLEHEAASALTYEVDDFGGDPGVRRFREGLRDWASRAITSKNNDQVVDWLIAGLVPKVPHPQPAPPASQSNDPGHLGQIQSQARESMEFLDFFNARIRKPGDLPAKELLQQLGIATEEIQIAEQSETHPGFNIPLRRRSAATRIRARRTILDTVIRHAEDQIGNLSSTTEKTESRVGTDDESAPNAAESPGPRNSIEGGRQARETASRNFDLWLIQRRGFIALLVFFFVGFLILTYLAWHDTYGSTTGEPFSLAGGTSVWPSEFLRLLTMVTALGLLWRGYCQLRQTGFKITRRFQLSLNDQESTQASNIPMASVLRRHFKANELWGRYQGMDNLRSRFRRVWLPALLYLVFAIAVVMTGHFPHAPIRGAVTYWLDLSLLIPSILLSVFLAFWTMDAAQLARWLIEHLIDAPTEYPQATLDRFKGRWGNVTLGLDEWLDMELIADLTESVSRLVYYPSVVFLLMLISRDAWWDRWPWPTGLMVVFTCNFAVAVISVFILQISASKARKAGIQRLEQSIDAIRVAQNPDPEKNVPEQIERILGQIKAMDRGAFVPFYSSPVWAALILPWGGTALFSLFSQYIQR